MIRARINIKVSNQAQGRRVANCCHCFLPGFLVAAVIAALPTMAAAEIHWHRDYQSARSAAAASGKPVFALFIATWDEEPSAAVFSNAEVEAVIAACFEPVRIDVDSEPDLIRDIGIQTVPSIAVIGNNGAPVSRLDCPTTPAEFVATAARAAQVSAATAPHRDEAKQGEAVGFATFGGSLESESLQDDTSVVDKVRQLSSFAEGKASPLRDPGRFPVAPQQPVVQEQPAYAVAASNDATLPRTPPAWQPEQPAASAYAHFQPPVANDPYAPRAPLASAAPSIEPAVTSANPWLAGTPGIAAEAEPEASATASDEGTEKKPAASSFMAALQKPVNVFSWWSAKPTTPSPPKMPPARPQSGGLFASQPPAVPSATASTASATAPQGSMPVGLEGSLGLEGYCAVTIAERGAWVEGRAQWGVRHRGRTYLFAGPEQQQAFMANPDRYAPALSGDDPVLAFESGRSEPGRRALGVSYQSRMYLFALPETRDAFAADPGRYTTRVQIAEGLAPADSARRF